MEEKTQSAYLEEQARLDRAIAQIDSQLARLEVVPRYHGEEYTEQVLESHRENSRRKLARATEEPYFGRMDFQEEGTEEPVPLYIGKSGVEDSETGQPLVIDWRAPVASLFYTFTGGELPASYDSPDGTVEGLIYLKRNLAVRKRILQRVVDSYVRGEENLAVTDEFLLYRLGENKDNRLRDIVSTIQAEQDQIIRAAKNTALIIQGVAGSGKTTVALHRLAFLLYQYRENISAERMIIFAPNSMFLDYISGVLPELGVGNIQQTTFTDWALNRLDEEVKLVDPSKAYGSWFAVGPDRPAIHDGNPGRYKGSAVFKKLLDECADLLEKNYLPDADFIPWDGSRLDAATLHRWANEEFRHYAPVKRRERTIGRLKRWLEMELDKVRDANRRKDLKKKAGQKLRTYLKNWPEPTPFAFYKKILLQDERPEYLPVSLLNQIPAEAIELSAKEFKKKLVRQEDLAPLLHLYNRFNGITSDARFDHSVIDEAQDFSPFQIALLKDHVRNESFSILGDLSQGIHAYQGILQWSEFQDLFEPDQSAYFQLDRSYRSTMEIIGFANGVLRRGGVKGLLAVPVFRSGDPVKRVPVPLGASMSGETAVTKPISRKSKGMGAGSPRQGAYRELIGEVKEILSTGRSNTIAVITRTPEAASEAQIALQEAGLEATLITAGERRYKGGLSVLPVYLAKGLEFDSVLLWDVNELNYTATPEDAKLLYVGCTRALHELIVLYSGTPSPLIGNDEDGFGDSDEVGKDKKSSRRYSSEDGLSGEMPGKRHLL